MIQLLTVATEIGLTFQFGFDALFFGRLDYEDKYKRENQTTMEMIWRGSPENLGKGLCAERCNVLTLLPKMRFVHVHTL